MKNINTHNILLKLLLAVVIFSGATLMSGHLSAAVTLNKLTVQNERANFDIKLAQPGVAVLDKSPMTLKGLKFHVTYKYPKSSKVYREAETIISIDHDSLERRSPTEWVGPQYSSGYSSWPTITIYTTKAGKKITVSGGGAVKTWFTIKKVSNTQYKLVLPLNLMLDAAPYFNGIGVATVSGQGLDQLLK